MSPSHNGKNTKGSQPRSFRKLPHILHLGSKDELAKLVQPRSLKIATASQARPTKYLLEVAKMDLDLEKSNSSK